MTYALTLVLSLLGGGALGLAYFGGLWLTVRRMHRTQRPKRLLLGSFFARAVLALGGFYAVVRLMGPRWELLALCLLGFLIARTALVRSVRPAPPLSRS